MLHTPYRIVIPALIIALPAATASAATFSLPSDAVVAIGEFTFPESTSSPAGQDLPATLHDRLADSLQKAGLTLSHGTAPVAEGAKTVPSAVTVTPITESVAEPEETNAAPGDAAGTETKTDAPDAASAETKNGTESEPAPESAESAEAEKPEETAENPDSAAAPGELPGEKEAQGIFAAPDRPPVYTLTGRVTFLRESIGAPKRIGSGIRIRVEVGMHCAYRVEDASGNVLISATASGSAARLTSDAHDVDAVVADLTNKVIADSAVKISSRLSGITLKQAKPTSEKDYYQDSPGKRLKKD